MNQFELLGASQRTFGEQRIDALVRHLKRRLRATSSGVIEITHDGQWEKLARAILVEARAVRIPKRSLSWRLLTHNWNKYQSEHRVSEIDVDDDSTDAENESLASALQSLCVKGIFFQGYEWRCNRCLHNNWMSVGSLGKMMVCEICGLKEPVYVVTPWRFKLNEFLSQSLREHGLLALIWCLHKLSSSARESFFFSPPLDLFEKYPESLKEQPNTEVDLICVIDRKVYACEVKSSEREIDLTRFIDTVHKLDPDVALLAVMEERTAALERKLEELRAALQGTCSTTKLMTLLQDDFEGDTFLPCLEG